MLFYFCEKQVKIIKNSGTLSNIMKETKMKRKFINAFTLAEVIIVIGIIGIVAEMVLPGVIANAEKQVFAAKVKEIYSILMQSTVNINNDCGGSLILCLSNPDVPQDDPTAKSEVINLYKKKFSLSKDCTDGVTTDCFGPEFRYLDGLTVASAFSSPSFATNSRVILKNGTAVGFKFYGTDSTTMYILFYVDVNNVKLPNRYGKDVFVFFYDRAKNTITMSDPATCATGTGQTCAQRVIQEGAITYY